jgi:DNA-binding transcriptional LysR family regulator
VSYLLNRLFLYYQPFLSVNLLEYAINAEAAGDLQGHCGPRQHQRGRQALAAIPIRDQRCLTRTRNHVERAAVRPGRETSVAERQRPFGGTVGAIDLKLFASTTIGNYLLPALISSFRVVNASAILDLRIGNTSDVVAAVSAFDTDVGFIEGPCHASDVQIVPWLEDELVIVASPAHELARLAKKARLSADQLRRALWLMREPGSGTRETVEQALLPHLAQFSSVMTIGSPEAIKNAVAEGLGISCVSRYVAQDYLATKRLCILATRLPRLTRRLMLIHHAKKLLSAPLSSFIVHCKKFADPSRHQDFEI